MALKAWAIEAYDRLRRRILGPPDKIPQRILTLALLVAVAIALAGAFVATRTGLEEAGTSSIPYLRPMLELATNTWVYVGLLAWVARRILTKRDQQYAEQAASITGYAARSVRRIAYEAKDPDGSTRVIATSDDSAEEIRSRILEAIETGEDDTLSLNPEALISTEERIRESIPAEAQTGRYWSLIEVYESLADRYEELVAEVEADMDQILEADMDPDAIASAIESDEDRIAPVDLLADADQDLSEEVDAKLAELEQNEDLREGILKELEEIDDNWTSTIKESLEDNDQEESEVETERSWRDRAAGVASIPAAVIGAARSRLRRDDQEESADVQEDDNLSDPWLEQYRLTRLDLASTLDFSELIWQLAIPAGLTVAALLVVVKLWVQPWLYPPIFAAGLLVGIANYARINWTRSRRLEQLRQERETVNWSDLSILVKEVDVPETRIQYAWLGDRRYAHDDREEFADEVALRALELVNGVEISPSVMEKQAEQIERMSPDLHGFRDNERARIMNWLLDAVEGSQYGILPKAKLLEDCIEHDLQERRFSPGATGKGYDPELVRTAYRELVPAALVEQEIELEDGSTLTAVRHRNDPLPPEFGQIRAQFSSQFSNYARWDPLYVVPDVSDALEEEPIYTDTLGFRGTA